MPLKNKKTANRKGSSDKSASGFLDYSSEKMARKICEQGDFQKILIDLNKKHLFEKEIHRVKSQYHEKLSRIDFLNRIDWELLTILELFDIRTFDHSLDTLFTMMKKIERPLENGLTFLDMLSQEKIDLVRFFRATLFHDIGKIAVPKFLLNSHFTDQHWAQAFIQLPRSEKKSIIKKYRLPIPEELRCNPEAVMEFLLQNRIRAAKFVPVKRIFSKEQLKELEKRNMPTDASLVEIMEIHEEESERILSISGYPVEAYLAGNHHNYRLNENPAKKSARKENSPTDIVGTIASDLIHLADIRSALRNERPYHSQKPRIKVMAFMMDDAERGVVDEYITYLWIKDNMQKLDKEDLNMVMHHNESHPDFEYLENIREMFEEVKLFLKKVSKKQH